MSDSLLSLLAAYAPTAVPMHMPGHKRNTALADYLGCLGAQLDITEIDGFDNLHEAHGVLRQAMEGAAALWGSGQSFFLVNGSTCGNLAAVRAVLGTRGGHVLAARNSHRSVLHALSLCRAETSFLWPEHCPESGICLGIAPAAVEQALLRRPDTRLVIITSPTYEGVLSDIAGICRAAHRFGVPVLVDEAHGAHLGFGFGFPDGAVKAGADLVVQSLHKTLPSLTQTALLHVGGTLVDRQRVGAALAMFETSSPSYLLMASIDGCVRLLRERGDALFSDWQQALDGAYARLSSLRHLRLLADLLPAGTVSDRSKLVISTAHTALSGPELLQRLRREYAIECEAATARTVLAMTGAGDTAATLLPLADALTEIDAALSSVPLRPTVQLAPPQQVLQVFEAEDAPCEPVPVGQAAGRISAEAVWAYPPGIALLLPGERIGADFAAFAAQSEACGVTLHSSSGQLPQKIRVLIDKMAQSCKI